jgi:hypothetical protein
MEGTVVDSHLSNGVRCDQDGSKSTGKFINDEIHGEAELFLDNNLYRGEFQRGKLKNGTCTLKSRKIQTFKDY